MFYRISVIAMCSQGRRSVFDRGVTFFSIFISLYLGLVEEGEKTYIYGDLVVRQRQLLHREVSERGVPPKKLASFVFLKLEPFNLVNSLRYKFRVN